MTEQSIPHHDEPVMHPFRATPPFALDEYQRRWDRLRTGMVRAGMDTVLVTSQQNYEYLSGQRSMACLIKSRPLAVVLPVAASPIGIVAASLEPCLHNPFGIEGYKAFAYEMLADLRRSPAMMLFPCARGNGLYGAWKGFSEAREFGWIRSAPGNDRMPARGSQFARSLVAVRSRGGTGPSPG